MPSGAVGPVVATVDGASFVSAAAGLIGAAALTAGLVIAFPPSRRAGRTGGPTAHPRRGQAPRPALMDGTCRSGRCQ